MHFISFRFVARAPYRPRWEGLVRIFQMETWGIFCIMLVISAVSWYIFGRAMSEESPHRELAMCFLNSWALFLGKEKNLKNR